MASHSEQLSHEDIRAGTIWRVKKTGERWLVTHERYDGPGTYRVVLLDGDTARRTNVHDTVWASEILKDAEPSG